MLSTFPSFFLSNQFFQNYIVEIITSLVIEPVTSQTDSHDTNHCVRKSSSGEKGNQKEYLNVYFITKHRSPSTPTRKLILWSCFYPHHHWDSWPGPVIQILEDRV